MNRNKYIRTFCKNLELLWLKHPEMRFFQMLETYTELGRENIQGKIQDPFFHQDDLIAQQILNSNK